MTKCVGAFRRACDNQTDTILCRDCYDFIDHVQATMRGRSANETRTVYRRKHAKAQGA